MRCIRALFALVALAVPLVAIAQPAAGTQGSVFAGACAINATANFSLLAPVIDTLRADALRPKSGGQPGGAGEISAVAKVKFVDPTLGQSERPLAVGPPISVLLTSPVVVAPVGGTGKSQIGVSVRSNVQSAVHAKTLYAAVNVARRSPPGPIFAELVSHPYYLLVGDAYWRFDQSHWTE